MNNFDYFKKGMRNGIPVCLGYLAVSFAFGILAIDSGLNPYQASLMSFVNLTSAGQYAALGSIAASAAYAELALTQLVINLRYSLMSASLSQKLDTKFSFFHRFFIAFGVTDEIFALSSFVQGKLNPYYSYGLIAVALPGWTLGTLAGGIMGSALPTRILNALNIALYAMFIAIIIPPAKKNKVIAGLIVISMAFSGIFALAPALKTLSSGMKIIILTVVLSAAAAIFFPIKEEEKEEEEAHVE